METKVIAKYLRIGPRKIRLVLNAIKGKPVHQAFAHLRILKSKGSRLAEKVLKSAFASATGKKMNESALFVKEVRSDGGPVFKRIMTRSMGRADRIDKRTAHVTIVLGEAILKKQDRLPELPAKEESKKGFFGGKGAKNKTQEARKATAK